MPVIPPSDLFEFRDLLVRITGRVDK